MPLFKTMGGKLLESRVQGKLCHRALMFLSWGGRQERPVVFGGSLPTTDEFHAVKGIEVVGK